MHTHMLTSTMLRKVFLTSTMPETAVVSPRTLPDVTQKMESYRREKRAYQTQAPDLRPHPLEKYDTRGLSDAIQGEERDEEVLNAGGANDENVEIVANPDETLALEDRYAQMIAALPAYTRNRAWRLLPFILDKDLGDLNLADVLYDLTSKSKKLRSTNLGTLGALYRQLNNDMTLPKSYYVLKHVPKQNLSRGALPLHTPYQSMKSARPGTRNAPQVAPASRSAPASPKYHSKASTPGTTALGEDFHSHFQRVFAPGSTFAEPGSVKEEEEEEGTTASNFLTVPESATPPAKIMTTSTPRKLTPIQAKRLMKWKQRKFRTGHSFNIGEEEKMQHWL